jgi:hypothetical protein
MFLCLLVSSRFPGGKARPGRDADHSPSSNSEVVNERELYILSPCASISVLWDSFNFGTISASLTFCVGLYCFWCNSVKGPDWLCPVNFGYRPSSFYVCWSCYICSYLSQSGLRLELQWLQVMGKTIVKEVRSFRKIPGSVLISQQQNLCRCYHETYNFTQYMG